MLKFIQYQIDDDTEAQQALEKQVSAGIAKNINSNIAAFREHIPSLVDIIDSHQIQQYSLFCTKEQQLNIVDFSTGRAFYGVNPQQDVSEELAQYFKAASYFSLTDADGHTWRRRPLPNSVDVMLVFGMGLGYHLTELISNCRIRFLVVYEPNLDMLMCSVQTHDWSMLLDTARALGTHIFIQAGSDASGITSELGELLQFDANLRDIYVYRHQFHPVMDEVINYLMENSGDLDKLTKAKPSFTGYQNPLDFVPEHAANTAAVYEERSYLNARSQARFDRNMKSLEIFFPEIWQNMRNYKPQRWFLVKDSQGQANLYNRSRKALFYRDLKNESFEVANYFIEHPFKDDVVVGMKTAGKLWSYLHFVMVDTFGRYILDKTLVKKCRLPKEVNCQIVFGLGLAKHLQDILAEVEVNNLFICEPNLDFFYASLFVTDFSKLLSKADKKKRRVYLNLGGDGSNYFYDLMSQYYQVGAYSIADTYMMAGYFNSNMQKSIFDLRSELKVVLALGEYYDHAKYGIAHTYHSVDGHHRFMKNTFSRDDYHAYKLPVFIVGNGPSLDECIEYLKKYQQEVYIVSCGTALKALHANGITPDFHSEIEQNRATYDWVSQIDDPDYLKQINLLSVNGIHPDTAELFKSVLLCFKDGEASTYIFSQGLKKEDINIASLSYAYPTVTNLVMNFFIRWGFKFFYLFGVDLGFHDVRKHHSSHSSYYDEAGEEVYDYQGQHGGGLPVKGNFSDTVFTKPEFDVSRKLLGQAISQAGHKVEVYNCSNGSLITGATPLLPENILLVSKDSHKQDYIESLIEETFYSEFSGFSEKIYSQFDPSKFSASMDEWLEIVKDDIQNESQARIIINKQWELFKSRAVVWDDLTFYLLHGSANYLAGVMAKLASNLKAGDEEIVKAFNFLLEFQRWFIREAKERYLSEPLAFDTISVQEMFEKDTESQQ